MTYSDVVAQIDAFCAKYETDENYVYGIVPGYEFEHIVLGDTNLRDEHIEFCLSRADAWLQTTIPQEAASKYKEAAVTFLRYLLTIPESVRVQCEEE